MLASRVHGFKVLGFEDLGCRVYGREAGSRGVGTVVQDDRAVVPACTTGNAEAMKSVQERAQTTQETVQ